MHSQERLHNIPHDDNLACVSQGDSFAENQMTYNPISLLHKYAYNIMHPAEPPSIPAHILEILSQEGNLPICVACGTQYPGPKDTCMICEDPRQAVPASGQSWTSLSELSAEGRRNTIVKDKDDERVGFIGVEPAFGINQHRKWFQAHLTRRRGCEVDEDDAKRM